MGDPLYVNVGCGAYPAPAPWVNVEADAKIAHDVGAVCADLLMLPFPDGSAQRIYLGHVLEHLDQDEVPLALAECKRVLAYGGEVCAVGPDVLRAHELRTMGKMTPEEEAGVGASPGAQPGDGAMHHWDCHQDRLLELFHLVFPGPHAQAVTLSEVRRNGYPLTSLAQWQCAVVGWKVLKREPR